MNNLKLIHQGKVRDLYDFGSNKLLMVATDRISAFDVIFNEKIKNKGEVLTKISNFWFDKTKHIIPNHLLDELPPLQFAKNSIVVKKLKPLPIEAIVRGYIIGSGWEDYQKNGEICGVALPKGLQIAQKLEKPIYTPSSKASAGDHDENINFEKTVQLVGEKLANKIQEISLKLYEFARDYADKKGIIIADTKFEFGLDDNNNLILMDEVLTPDSSRFWDKKNYTVGVNPQSFDKQILRDYLNELTWNKNPPPPKLPSEILKKTSNKYQEVQKILCN